MKTWDIISVCDHPEWIPQAAAWQSSKWNIPLQAYLDSMEEGKTAKSGVPAWYMVLNDKKEIIAGIGIIENDFHKRRDLRPNLCALYVEASYRKQGLAKALLDHCCERLAEKGLHKAYLCTNHTDFYERCGWSFYGMIEEDSSDFCRMYEKEF